MRTGIVIQARLNSKRLSGKVLLPITEEITVIEEILDIASSVKNCDKVILATTDKQTDDRLVEFVTSRTNFEVYRGSEDNVLKRFCDVAEKFDFDNIVRLTGDNPCIDASIVEKALNEHLLKGSSYTHTVGYPIGMNVEVISRAALLESLDHAEAMDKEHVTFYARNHKEKFAHNIMRANFPKEVANLRLTLDSKEDYLMLRILFDYLKSNEEHFSFQDIFDLWQRKPYIFTLNQEVYQKRVFKNLSEELNEAAEILDLQEMFNAADILKSYQHER
ncbi:hypothetical protein [uncultured Arcticibacterium sp.]|uniref:cytidylyltransferase domain-containing protein n=1 Tax=uncultured Arcticibacterium sp. TaxID=2173042 RepID=UPI0030F7D099